MSPYLMKIQLEHSGLRQELLCKDNEWKLKTASKLKCDDRANEICLVHQPADPSHPTLIPFLGNGGYREIILVATPLEWQLDINLSVPKRKGQGNVLPHLTRLPED